jgi:DNA-damage-inducible protein J
MAVTTTMVHVRVDEKIKAQATETLGSMGLTISEAVCIFLTRIVADNALPFTIQTPNQKSRAAIAEADQIVQNRRVRLASADARVNERKET